MIKAAIFDMDGTLANTTYRHFRIWKKVLLELGVRITYNEWRPFIGREGYVFIRHINSTRNIELDAEKLREYKRKLIDNFYRNEVRLFPGVKKLIRHLHANGIILAVASGEWHSHITDLLKKNSIGDYFSTVLGLEDVKKQKPDPDIFLKAAKKLGVKPAECVVFEDSLAGVEAAKKAGMKCIAVETTFNEKELSKADLVVNNLKDKEKIINFILN